MAFASCVSEIALSEGDDSNRITNAFSDALTAAFMQTTGTIETFFINKINQFVSMFAQTENDIFRASAATVGTSASAADGAGGYRPGTNGEYGAASGGSAKSGTRTGGVYQTTSMSTYSQVAGAAASAAASGAGTGGAGGYNVGSGAGGCGSGAGAGAGAGAAGAGIGAGGPGGYGAGSGTGSGTGGAGGYGTGDGIASGYNQYSSPCASLVALSQSNSGVGSAKVDRSQRINGSMDMPRPGPAHKIVTKKLITDIDYHIFGPLKKSLNRQRFHTVEEVKATVLNWFHDQQTSFFADEIRNLPKQWDNCLNHMGYFF